MKIVIIGGGPGGYSAAIRAAQLGAEVTLIEKNSIGGVCLNEGCIPTKALLNSAGKFSELKELDKIGIDINSDASLNWDTVLDNKNEIVKLIVGSISTLLKLNSVRVIEGVAEIYDENKILVKSKDDRDEKIEYDKLIISTGSSPIIPNIPGIDSSRIITSSEALSLKEIPKKLTIIGGGVIGIEFAEIFQSIGAKVTIIEMLPNILDQFDKDISDIIKKRLMKKGVDFNLGCKVTNFKSESEGISVVYEKDGSDSIIESELVLLSIGRKPNTNDLGLEKINIQTERGFIKIDDSMKTSNKSIYAVGDCTGKNMLAHVAAEQGIAAVENIFDIGTRINYDCIPAGIFCSPEVASVGLTEKEATKREIDFKLSRFPLFANGKTLIDGGADGIIKIVADSEYNQILGAQIVGPRATEIISEFALAISMEATAEQIISTVHPHPTISESIKEAAVNLMGSSIYSY